MKRRVTKLSIDRETIRTLAGAALGMAHGGLIITESDVCGPSDASGCPTHEWSCINMSCTRATDPQ